jgi:hypothetical protein
MLDPCSSTVYTVVGIVLHALPSYEWLSSGGQRMVESTGSATIRTSQGYLHHISDFFFSSAEPHHFYAAPAPDKNFGA